MAREWQESGKRVTEKNVIDKLKSNGYNNKMINKIRNRRKNNSQCKKREIISNQKRQCVLKIPYTSEKAIKEIKKVIKECELNIKPVFVPGKKLISAINVYHFKYICALDKDSASRNIELVFSISKIISCCLKVGGSINFRLLLFHYDQEQTPV